MSAEKGFKVSNDYISTKKRLEQLDDKIRKHEDRPAGDDDDIAVFYNEIFFLFGNIHELIEIIIEKEK